MGNRENEEMIRVASSEAKRDVSRMIGGLGMQLSEEFGTPARSQYPNLF